jgi:transposase
MLSEDFEELLELEGGWHVEGAERDKERKRITVRVACGGAVYRCPKCGGEAKLHDMRQREIRHLDTMQYQTYLKITFPRVRCPVDGVQAVLPPFAASGSRFSQAFEARVVELCHGSTVLKAAKDLHIGWHIVERIKDRAYRRMAGKREGLPPRKVSRLAIDETSFRKHHDYSTIASDADSGTVLAVLDGRDSETLKDWFNKQKTADFSGLKSVSMDMAPPYIKAVRDTFPLADQIICYDRFHVAQLFSRAVDAVRRRESAAYRKAGGDNPLAGTRFDWLRNSGKTDNRAKGRRGFLALTRELKGSGTAEAWEAKERAALLWDYTREGAAEGAWERLLLALSGSGLEELKKLCQTLREHLGGILNAVRLRANNAAAEARNSCIQRIKYTACGFRDKERFGREILFQFGGLAGERE